METKLLNKEILRLAIPSIIANITVPFVGIVDMAIAGHIESSMRAATLIGGITIGSMMFDLLYWNFGFLRAGTGGLTAQAYGSGDKVKGVGFLLKGVMLSMFIALCLILIQVPFTKIIFLFIDASDEVSSLALQYFFIRIWAAPATLSLMAFKGWFIGMQDSVSAMLTDFIVNGVNIIASIVLAMGIGGLGFKGIGYAGIALGTVIAQYSGLLFVFIVLFSKYFSIVRAAIKKRAFLFKGRDIRSFAVLNSDLFVRSLCFIAVYIGFTIISARFGDLLLAVSSVMMKLLMLFSFFTDGFAFAGEALVGKYIGGKDRMMTRKSVNNVFLWSMGIGMGFIIIYLLAGEPILHIMTDNTEVIETCKKYFIWLMPMPLIGCAAFTFDGIFIGATASKDLRNASLVAVFAFFAVWLCLKPFSSDPYTLIHFLMAAYFAHLAGRTIYQWATYKKAILERPFIQ